MQREARMLCRQLVEDILSASRLKKKFPNRIAIFRYEDYVANPNQTISYMYGRLDETYRSYVPSRINTLMHSSRIDDDAFGYVRHNATQTANKWRTEINPEVKEFIDSECVGVLKALKYDA